MLLKQPHFIGKGRFYDLLHRGCVTLCMGISLFAFIGMPIAFNWRAREESKEALTFEVSDEAKEGEAPVGT